MFNIKKSTKKITKSHAKSTNHPKYVRREMTIFLCKEDIILVEGIVKISL